MSTKGKTRLALDVDGVLRDFANQIVNMVKRTGIQMEYPKKYEFLDVDIDGETVRNKIFGTKTWAEEVFTEAPLMEKAKTGYELFCNDPNFQVYIVTAQRQDVAHYTQEWLDDNGFNQHFDTVYTFNKTSAPCQVIIDDYPKYIKDYTDSGRMAIIVDHLYNQEFEHPLRVNDLIEAYELLREV